MQKFEIVLMNEKIRSYEKISWLSLLINFFGLFFISININEKPIVNLQFIAAGIIFISVLYILLSKKTIKVDVVFNIAFIVAALGWFLSGFIWFSVINLLLLALKIIAFRKLELVFSPEKIIFPSFPKKTIQWAELNNVILKDEILTTDFKNNKLIQSHIDQFSSKVNETYFNDFCSQQLKSNTKSN